MSQEMPGAVPPPSVGSTKNSFERIVGVFFSPKQIFDDINRKPDILVPLALIVLISLATTYVFLTHVDLIELMTQQIEKSGRTVPSPEQLQTAVKITTYSYYGGVIIGTPIILAIYAGILFVIFSFIPGGETTYKKVFSMNLYASLISALKSVLAIPILFVKQLGELGNPADVVQSNLGVLIPADNKALHALGKSLDVFTLWYVVVLAIGLVGVSKNLTFKKALTTLIIIWAVITAGVVAWVAFKK